MAKSSSNGLNGPKFGAPTQFQNLSRTAMLTPDPHNQYPIQPSAINESALKVQSLEEAMYRRLVLSSTRSLTHSARHLKTKKIIEVEGPSFAESISYGDIRWLKSELLSEQGDLVKEDEVVAEIETDKTNVEVPSPHAGKIVELLAEEGAKVVARQKLYKLEKSDD